MQTVRVQATQNVDYPLAWLAEMFGFESDLPPVKLFFTLVMAFTILTTGK